MGRGKKRIGVSRGKRIERRVRGQGKGREMEFTILFNFLLFDVNGGRPCLLLQRTVFPLMHQRKCHRRRLEGKEEEGRRLEVEENKRLPAGSRGKCEKIKEAE